MCPTHRFNDMTSQTPFGEMADKAPAILWLTAPSGQCTYLSRGWYDFTGQQETEALGMGWLNAVHPDDREMASKAFSTANAAQGVFRIDYRLRRSDGAYRWAIDVGQPYFGEDGTYLGFIGSVIDIHERKQIEAALQAREQQLQLVMDYLPALVSYIGPDYCYKQVNNAYVEWFNTPAIDIIGRPMWEILGDQAWNFIKPHIDNALAGEVTEYDEALPYSSGTKYVHVSYVPDKDSEGQVRGVVALVTDVTEARQAAMALMESEERFRTMADNVPALIWMSDQHKQNIYVNKTWLDFTGRSFEQECGDGWLDAVHPDDIEKLAPCADAFKKKIPFETQFRLRRADGVYRWVQDTGIPRFSKNGSFLGFIGSCIDITEQKKAEILLRDNEQRFRSVFNLQFQFMAILSPAGTVLEINELPLQAGGVTREDVLGRYFWDTAWWDGLPHMKNSWPERLELAAQKSVPVLSIDEYRAADGSVRIADAAITAVRDEMGVLIFYIVQANDITEREKAKNQLQAALNQAQAANQAKTDFLANMSHEIRTPMNAVIGLSNILAMDKTLNERQKQFVTTLLTSAESLMLLINDMLDIAKIESSKIELEAVEFKPADLINECVSISSVEAQKKGLAFTISNHFNKNLVVVGDPLRLRQIIMNLLSNAIKFTEKGFVSVTTEYQIPTDTQQPQLVCKVKDSGIGIAPHLIDRIFDKFSQADTSTTRKYGGSGLGLAITKSLTELMNGTISVISEEDKGSEFIVRIPLKTCDFPMAAGHVKQELPAKQNSHQTILLVEDYEPNILVATTMLDDAGYYYQIARSGEEALNIFREQKFSLILMDIQMAGLDGYETTHFIRLWEEENNSPPTPIIAMTAHALRGDKERCLAAGMNDYLAKPFNPRDLREKIAFHLQVKPEGS